MVARQGRWCDAEDVSLRAAVAKEGTRNWKRVAELVAGRDHQQCRQRWRKVLDPGLKKGPWTQEEDELLLKAVKLAGTAKWACVAQAVPGRNSKQCRERFTGTLDPSIHRGPWSEKEDKLVLQARQRMRLGWAEIRNRFLPSRNESQIKTRYMTLRRGFLKDEIVQPTVEQVQTLRELHARYDGDLEKVHLHVPSKLKGISMFNLRRILSLEAGVCLSDTETCSTSSVCVDEPRMAPIPDISDWAWDADAIDMDAEIDMSLIRDSFPADLPNIEMREPGMQPQHRLPQLPPPHGACAYGEPVFSASIPDTIIPSMHAPVMWSKDPVHPCLCNTHDLRPPHLANPDFPETLAPFKVA